VDARVRLALSRSNLRDLPGDVLDELLVGASRVRIPAGSVTHWEGEPAPFLELVISGVVRVFVSAPDGRTMTIRYCRPGALIGAASLFATPYAMPAPTQALVDAEMLRMSPTVARHTAERDVRVATALLSEVASERLPEPASEQRSGSELVVRVSQRELADAVGTAREVVVRVLRELRQEGVVWTGRDQIVIADPARLIQEHGWNPGS
jgi:CRP/FNR family transcriptional regulator, cyclic AMP receptor protein